MNGKARFLILVGTGLATSALAIGPARAGTAQASTTPARDAVPAPVAQAPFNADPIGYFADRNDCDWVGRAGQQQNRWNSYDCDRADGPYRGLWSLDVRRFNPGGPITMPGGPHPMPMPNPVSTGSAQSNGGHPHK
jgi:hypothetical protein